MKILFLMHYFQPEPNFFMGLPFAKELVRRGHQVQVLTGFPNYPGGKIFDGYKQRLIMREEMEGVPIIRVPLYPSHDRSSIKRMLSYASLSTSQALIGTFAIEKADVAYVCQGPATIGLPAKTIKLLRRIPFVYNIQDLWPDSLASTGMFDNGLGMKILHFWCKSIYKSAAKIAVITPGMKQRLIERGVPEEKIEVVYNWCDDANISSDEYDQSLADELGFTGKFNIVFAGNMGKAQALGAVIDAADILKESCPDIQFVLIGSGVEVESLKKKTKDLKLENVKFLARRPIEEIGKILQLSDALLVHLCNDPLFEITIPSKTQAYMAAGKPVLIGVKGDAANLVESAEAGVACESENPDSIAKSARALFELSEEQRSEMGKRAANFYNEKLSFKVGVDKYESIFERIISK